MPDIIQNPSSNSRFKWGIVLGVGAIIGGVYVMRKYFYNSKKSKSKRNKSTKSHHPFIDQIETQPKPFAWDDENEDIEESDSNIIIAVDATPHKCAGLLRLPKKKKIFYYSTTWHPHFNFENVSDQSFLETVNTLVALEKFKRIIDENNENNENDYQDLTIKTDNDFYTTDDHEIMTNLMDEKIRKLKGHWTKFKINEDMDVQSVHTLARNVIYADTIHQNYPGHIWTELGDIQSTLLDIKQIVPPL